MGREARMVPADWEHPKRQNLMGLDVYRPLFESYASALSDWEAEKPDPDDYMPDWPAEKRTHVQMYEDTTEGTPISPPMETPEALAQWLVDNGASSFGSSTATYEQWLRVAKGGWAPSAVIDAKGLRSGVEL